MYILHNKSQTRWTGYVKIIIAQCLICLCVLASACLLIWINKNAHICLFSTSLSACLFVCLFIFPYVSVSGSIYMCLHVCYFLIVFVYICWQCLLFSGCLSLFLFCGSGYYFVCLWVCMSVYCLSVLFCRSICFFFYFCFYMSVYLSVLTFLSVFQSDCQSAYPPSCLLVSRNEFIFLSASQSLLVYQSIRLAICLPVCVFVFLSSCLSSCLDESVSCAYLSVYVFICLPVLCEWIPVFLSVCPSAFPSTLSVCLAVCQLVCLLALYPEQCQSEH